MPAEPGTARPVSSPLRRREIDWGAAGSWALGFLPVAYLGLEGGGFDPLVHDRAGIAVWWLVLATVLVGSLPRSRPTWLALAALGLLAAFVAWTALSLEWTESTEKTAADLARVVGYLGVFALAVLARGAEQARRLVGGVAAGVVCVAAVALLSRLEPSWFPAAGETAKFLSSGQGRLSYPLHYWNALATLVAIGLPLVLQIAATARSIALRGLAAAALPALGLTSYLTLSRGGIAVAFLALAVFLALAPDRLPKLLTLLPAACGGAVLVVAAGQRDALQDGLTGVVAERQGDELLAMTLVVCLAVGLLQTAASLALRDRERPDWTIVPRGASLVATAVAAVALLSVAVALGVPDRTSDAWTEFKHGDGPGRGTERLGSVSGQGRYQLWVAAVDQNASSPWTGTGPGTFEYWWARKGDESGTVVDAHSLYLQTLGELGIVGLVLLGAFLLTVLLGGVGNALRADTPTRAPLAAAVAGCSAFCVEAAFDWHWQIPALPVALLLLAAALVGGSERPVRLGAAALRWPLRLAVAVAALAAILTIATPLASTALLRESEARAREGNLTAALGAARRAEAVQPGTAAPRLQQALLLEQLGALPAAAAAARAAAEREATNWRPWLVLSRLEARRGRSTPAVRAYRRARSLNPHSSLFGER